MNIHKVTDFGLTIYSVDYDLEINGHYYFASVRFFWDGFKDEPRNIEDFIIDSVVINRYGVLEMYEPFPLLAGLEEDIRQHIIREVKQNEEA